MSTLPVSNFKSPIQTSSLSSYDSNKLKDLKQQLLKAIARANGHLTEFAIHRIDLPLPDQFLEELKSKKSLRKLTVIGSLNKPKFKEIFLATFKELLDGNTNILDLDCSNSNYIKLPDLKIRIERNKTMKECREKELGDITVECCLNSLEMCQFLEHRDWGKIFSKRRSPLNFKLKAIEGRLFDNKKIAKLLSSEKISFTATRYLCGGQRTTPLEEIDRNFLKGVRAITNDEMYRNNQSINNYGHRIKVPDSDFKLIIDLLKKNASILSMDLANAGINDEVIYSLAKAIKTNTKIIWLNLSENPFSVTAAKAFFNAVANNKHITNVFMEKVNIEGRHLKSIVDALSTNHSLLRLYITPTNSENNILRKGYYNVENNLEKRGYFKKDSSRIERYLTKNQGYRDQAIIKIRDGNTKELNQLLQRGVSPNARDTEGKTLLHHAVTMNRFEIFRILIEQGANVDVLDNAKKNCIDMCKSDNDKQQFIKIMHPPKQVKIGQFFSSTPSTKSSTNKKRELRKEHLGRVTAPFPKRVKISPPSDERASRFQVACVNGDFNLVQKMLAETSSVSEKLHLINSQTHYGKTPAHLAAYGGHTELLKLLIEHSATLSTPDFAGRLALHDAVVTKKPDKMEDLVKCLVNHDRSTVDAKDKAGTTPLFLLAGGFEAHPAQTDKFRAAGAYVLLNKGAKPNTMIKDFHLNHTIVALHKAIYNGFYYLMKAIVQSSHRGLNLQDDRGWGPLHYAVTHQKPANVNMLKRLLIEPEINIRLSNSSLQTPLALLKKSPESTACKEMEKCFSDRESRHQLGDSHTGIVWTRSMKIHFKDLVIDLSDTHEALKNSVKRWRNGEGNFVAARLTFIVSDTKYIHDGKHSRISVPIELNLVEKMHVSSMWKFLKPISGAANTSYFKKVKRRSPDALGRILGRFQAAPSDIKKSCIDDPGIRSKKAMSDKAIRKAYDTSTSKFELTFHHSEQALFDHLEDPKTIDKIINSLQKESQVKVAAKVYGVILSMHSKYYVCPNCEISAFGEHKILSNNLGTALKKSGYKLPKTGMKVLTTVTTTIPYKTRRRTKDDHGEYVIDMRSLKNNGLILSQDINTISRKHTAYVSRR